MTKPLATISHLNLYGRRNEKYDTLEKLSVQEAKWTNLAPAEPYYFFVPKDFSENVEYEKGFKVDDLMKINNSWVSTDRDWLFLDWNKEELEIRMVELLSWKYSDIFKSKFNVNDSSWYPLINRIKWKMYDEKYITKYQYRPFDFKNIYFDNSIISRPAKSITDNLLGKANIWLIVPRQVNDEFHHIFITKYICDSNITSSARLFWAWKVFPLYLYSDSENLENQIRTPNLDETIWSAINAIVGETTPEQILDYIYAVLHCPSYREKYREFLKIDFPRVPYPRDRESFLALVALGGELRSLHLLESSKVEDFITSYPLSGDNVVEAVKYADEKVFINATQYFGGVPESVWTHPIGGYMPAQKWLKDRKGRTLTNDDIMHYQRMIVALAETARVMEEVDGVINI